MSEPGPFGVRDRPEGEPPPRAPAPPPPAVPGGRSTVTWILGVAIVIAFAYITLNTIRTDAPGSRGVEAGDLMPPFAAPLALSRLEGNANLATAPNQGEQGRRPACEVRGPDIVNSCELAERGPVVVAFFADRSDVCLRQVDALDRLRATFPDVGFTAVAIKGERAELRELIRRRGWKLPVAHDQDGGVANAYAVAICPTMTFVREGGRVQSTSLTPLEGAALRERVARLRSGS